MNTTLYVIDTSYLIEIAGCGRDSQPKASAVVRARFIKAAKQGARFFVPLPCLFELGNHIADVDHIAERHRLAGWLCATVATCLRTARPWIITPTQSPEDVLPPLLERFVPLASKQQIGLVDAFTVDEAKRLKVSYGTLKNSVHIWTNDGPLKKLEPDAEPDPYLWKSDGSPR